MAEERRPKPRTAAPSSGAPRVEVTLEREYASPGEAAALFRALEPDRPDYLEATCDGPRLRFRVVAANAASARATLEDLLAALSAAERARAIGPAGGARRGSSAD
jgi:hypothetical protein